MIVVGCGKAKLDVPAPARELYRGSLFRAARHYAELSGQRWAILSAAHGVIDPHVVLRPYDQRISNVGPYWLTRWARLAADGIIERLPHATDRVEILAGKEYADPLARELEAMEISVVKPLEGLGLGYRIRKLYELADGELARRGHCLPAGEGMRVE